MKNFLSTSLILILLASGIFAAFHQLDPDFKLRFDAAFGASVPSNALTAATEDKPASPSRGPSTAKPAAGRWAKIDAYAIATPKTKSQDIPTLAGHLVKGAKDDWEKARAIFRWITTNISYDDDAYNTKQYGSMEPEDILKARKGVCEQFCILFKAMVEAAGLKAETISGYAKGYSYTPGKKLTETDHAWNAVFIEGSWHLLDATWAEGYGSTKNGKLVSTKRFDDGWFDTDPSAFVFKHLPEDSKWQLLPQPITKAEYEVFPEADLQLFQFGYDGKQLIQALRRDKTMKLPETFAHPFSVHATKPPMGKYLEAGEPIAFTFECDNCVEMAIINAGEWTMLEQNGKTFSGTLTPKEGKLSINGKAHKKDRNFSSIIHYEVTKAKPARKTPA
jgi:transglutaminase-like putative cysteine protease